MRKWIFLLVALLLLLSPLVGGCGGKKYDLTVSVGPTGGGTTSPAVGTHEYDKDEVVTVTATASTGYQFVNWTGDASGTTATATVTMDKDKSVKANFAKIQYTLTIAKVGNGTTNPTVGAHTYDSGTAVSITATPDTGSHFVNWTGDATGTTATVSVTMSANKTVTANFALSTFTLTMAIDDPSHGTIDPGVGAHTEDPGATVDLTATPDTGWRFDEWTGDVTTVADVEDPTTTVTMNGDYTITANFIQVFTLTMAVDPADSGTTDPAVGDHTYDIGTVVDITATPADGWFFVSWSGDVADPNSETTTVTMDADKTVTANFTQTSVTLTIAVDPADSGTTTPAVGPSVYGEGRIVTITATPATGWKFDSWSGDVTNVAYVNAASTTITMDADYSITANFVAIPQYTLTLAVDGSGTTSALPAPPHYEGDVVNITATPATGSFFVHWIGDVANPISATTTVTMDADKTVTAVFYATPGVDDQWVYTVTYGTETTQWTVSVTTAEAAPDVTPAVSCYKTATVFDTNPVRVSGSTTLTVLTADTWRSVSNLAQYEVKMDLQVPSVYHVKLIDTYTSGTPNFFTVGTPPWSFHEAGGQTPVDYTVAVVGQETVLGHNCYKVEYSLSGNVVKTEWWSPDVMGIVKQVDTGSYAQTETRELVSFSLA